MDLPETVESITPEMLSSALGVDVANLEVTPVAAQGALSSAAQLRFEPSEVDQPRTLFAKAAHPSEVIRGAVRQTASALREVRFYQTFGTDTDLPIPRCYFAELSEDHERFLLLLEDLGDGRVGNYFRSDLADVERVLAELPAFHARWWGGVELPSEGWLWCADLPAVAAGYQQGLQGTVPITTSRFSFTDEFRAATEALTTRFTDVAAHWRGRAVTLLHGDLHLQQVFFPGASGGRFALFDWQTVMVGNPGIDLARVITMDLTAEDRRAHERTLVARYHAGLVAAGVSNYDLDACWQDYRLGQVWSAMMLMNAGSVIMPEAVERLATASGGSAEDFIGRMGHAWTDLEVGEFFG